MDALWLIFETLKASLFFLHFFLEPERELSFTARVMFRQTQSAGSKKGFKRFSAGMAGLMLAACCTVHGSPAFAEESEKFDDEAPYYLKGLDKGLVFGGVVTGGVGLGLGILFTSLSLASASQASSLSDEILASPVPGCVAVGVSATGQAASSLITSGKCGELETALEDRNAYRVGALVGFATAGAALLAVGGYALIGVTERKQEALVLTPVIGPTVGGFALQGRF